MLIERLLKLKLLSVVLNVEHPTTMMPGRSTPLLQLPNELLLDIFSGFDRTTLLRLATLCRHLCALTHSILLRRQITHLQTLVDHGDLATHGKSIEYLLKSGEVTAVAGPLVLNLKYKSSLSDDLHAFYALVLRLRGPIRVELRLSPAGCSDTSGDAARRWPFELAAVMNVIAEKPQSTFIVTRGISWKSSGRPFKYTINVLPSSTRTPVNVTGASRDFSCSDSILQHLVRPVLRLLGKLRMKYKPDDKLTIEAAETDPPPPVGIISQTLKPCPNTCPRSLSPVLEAFHIHSSLLFHLPLFFWTLEILNTAPIKRLSFSDVELTLHDWAYILASITIPTLEDLSLQQSPVAIALPDLHNFLKRHPSITVLDLARHVAIGDPTTPSSEDILPHLIKYSAHPEYLLHFLNSPFASPRLKHIVIAPERNISDLNSYAQYFKAILDHLAQRTQDLTLSLNFSSEAALILCLFPVHEESSTQQERRVKCVTVLEISTEQRFEMRDADEHSVFRQFLRFPSLQDVSFVNVFPDSYCPKDEVWDLHPHLQTLQVSGLVYKRPKIGILLDI